MRIALGEKSMEGDSIDREVIFDEKTDNKHTINLIDWLRNSDEKLFRVESHVNTFIDYIQDLYFNDPHDLVYLPKLCFAQMVLVASCYSNLINFT